MLPTTKLTARQESFCQHLVDGLNQTAAYKAAGYSVDNKLSATVYQAASRLAADSKVVARVTELRNQITAGKAWSFAHGIEEVETNITKARQLNQMAAAIRGTEQALKLSGLLEAQPQGPGQITKVTVILNHGPGRPATDTREIVDGTSRVLDPAEEE